MYHSLWVGQGSGPWDRHRYRQCQTRHPLPPSFSVHAICRSRSGTEFFWSNRKITIPSWLPPRWSSGGRVLARKRHVLQQLTSYEDHVPLKEEIKSPSSSISSSSPTSSVTSLGSSLIPFRAPSARLKLVLRLLVEPSLLVKDRRRALGDWGADVFTGSAAVDAGIACGESGICLPYRSRLGMSDSI